MIDYKFKVIHYEEYTLNLFTMIQNGKDYPRGENNLGDYFSMFLTDDCNLCDTIIADNTDLRSDNITEIIDSVISSFHIGGAKYRIHSRKIETDTNITIQKITESIDSNTILEGIDDEGSINLFLNTKYIVILVDTISPIQNTPHSMSLVFCEIIVRDSQYKTKA